MSDLGSTTGPEAPTSPVKNTTYLSLDPLVEVVVGLLIVRPDQRPSWVRTYDDARSYAEAWAKRLRRGPV